MTKVCVVSVLALIACFGITISNSTLTEAEDPNENAKLLELLAAIEVAAELQDYENPTQQRRRLPVDDKEYSQWLAEKQLEEELIKAIGIKDPADASGDGEFMDDEDIDENNIFDAPSFRDPVLDKSEDDIYRNRIFGNNIDDADDNFDAQSFRDPALDKTEDGIDWNRIFGNNMDDAEDDYDDSTYHDPTLYMIKDDIYRGRIFGNNIINIDDTDDSSDYIVEKDLSVEDDDGSLFFDDDQNGRLQIPLYQTSDKIFVSGNDLEGSGDEESLKSPNLDKSKQPLDVFGELEKSDHDGVVDEEIELTINIIRHRQFFKPGGF